MENTDVPRAGAQRFRDLSQARISLWSTMSNATDDSAERRYILGGSWDETITVFTFKDSRPSWDRSPGNGFRCAYFPPEESALTDVLFDPLRVPGWRDFSSLTSFSDEEFAGYQAAYRYDRTPLNAKIEGTDDHSIVWRREKVTFDAVYGADRVTAHLYLPKRRTPPYQTVIFFPGGSAITDEVFSDVRYARFIEFITHGGRTLLFPVYYGTYGRAKSRFAPSFPPRIGRKIPASSG